MGLLDEIRVNTHDVHVRLHDHPMTKPLVSSMLDLDHYKLVISTFEKFYTALSLQLPDEYVSQLNLPALKKDLISLNINTNAIKPCELPIIVCNKDSIYGMLYVIEGSRMGGQVIAKNVNKTLNLNNTNGLAFFTGNGKSTATHWKSFIQKLQSKNLDKDSCIKAAEQTFLLLEHWLWSAWNENQNEILIDKQKELA